MTTPDAPVAYDLDAAGSPVPSMVLRVDGVRWPEAPSLYGAGPAEVHAVRLGPDGAVTAVFGDGAQGARLPTGRGNVTASYRVGGGTEGEVESEAIDALLGSVRGVKRVSGAGPTSGGADQDDEARIRSLAPRRARAFGRAVSAQDLVDLALGYPGVTHAAAWHGAGPPGHACGGSGLHLALVRASASGPRAPLPDEVASLAAYLDARRDATVPLCVCAGSVAAVAVTASLAVDPRRDPAAVAAAAAAALTDPLGPLAPAAQALGEPLDRSDLLAVIHGAEGVVGVAALDLPGAGELGRRPAERWELLTLAPPAVTGAAA
jgi:predicted phage baseplate assembly protein